MTRKKRHKQSRTRQRPNELDRPPHPAGGAPLIPSPAERLAASLEHVPDACREILAQISRAQTAGGGDVLVRLLVDGAGNVEVELPRRYSRRVDGGCTLGSAKARTEPGR